LKNYTIKYFSLVIFIFSFCFENIIAQNNAIFYGGDADGFIVSSYTQADVAVNNSIFNGGNSDGFSVNGYTQPDVAVNNTVFYGGNADGFSNLSYIQPDVTLNNTVFYGGDADGFSNLSYIQPDATLNNTVFYGGDADGFSNLTYTQPDIALNNTVFYGGDADGFSNLSYIQPDVALNNTVFYGGNADGFTNLSYIQPDAAVNNTVFYGGIADGFGFNSNSSTSSYIWNVASGNWSTPTNWTPTRTISDNSDILIFDGSTQATPTVNLDFGASATIGKITFKNGVSPTFSNSETQSLITTLSVYDDNSFSFLGGNQSNTPVFSIENTSNVDLTGVTNFTINLPTNADTLYIDDASILNLANTNQISGSGSSGYVKVKGTFKTDDPDGFSGAANTSVANTVAAINLSTASTIDYNAAGTQTVSSRADYQNITFSGSGTKTLNGNIDVEKNLTISGTANLDAATFDINLAGNWVNNSTDPTPFIAGTRTVTFDGTAVQNIGGSAPTTFYNLFINNTGAGINQIQPITISNTITLDNGKFNLNSLTATVLNPSANAITRNNGLIVSETQTADNPSILQWNIGTNIDAHVFPFGTTSGDYIPVTFTGSGTGPGNISISTRATALNDNQPWTTGVTSMSGVGDETTTAIDRWWNFSSSLGSTIPAVTLTLSYIGSENTISSPTDILAFQHWNGTIWNDGRGGISGSVTSVETAGSTTGINSVTASGLTEFSPYILVREDAPLPIELLSFTANCNNRKIILNWTTASELNSDYFTIEQIIYLPKPSY